MLKNNNKLAIKLFIIVWIVLAVHIVLKLTFNYWQSYVIPNETLGAISDFIDDNRWIQATLNGVLYIFNGIIVLLCCIQEWWFKNKKQAIFSISIIIICFLLNIFLNLYDITPFISTIILPLILNRKKWLYMILTFVFNNLFLLLSLWLEGFVKTNDMQYLIQTFFLLDYYIMMMLFYFVVNLKKERVK